MTSKKSASTKQNFLETAFASLQLPRRKFLSVAAATAGTLALAACGGGGSDPVPATTGPVEAKANGRPSDDGATIPPLASITDTSGAVWTVVDGVIYKNQAKAANTHSVTLLVWLGGNIYHRGTNSQFYR